MGKRSTASGVLHSFRGRLIMAAESVKKDDLSRRVAEAVAWLSGRATTGRDDATANGSGHRTLERLS